MSHTRDNINCIDVNAQDFDEFGAHKCSVDQPLIDHYIQNIDDYNGLVLEKPIIDNEQYFHQMQEYESLRPFDDESPAPKKQPSLITKIEQQYLGDSLAQTLAVHRVVCVLSGMGTGKSTAMRLLLAKYETVFYCCPQKKLSRSMADDLGLTYYEDYKRESCTVKRAEMARRIVGTPQMLALLLKHDPDIKFSLIVFDESESVADLIISDACKNKAEVIEAIEIMKGRADKVAFMDADLGYKTKALMQATGINDYHLLENTFKRWKDTKATILDGSSFKVRKQKVMAMIERDIKAGVKLAIYVSSKKHARKIEGIINKLFGHTKTILIDADSNTPEVTALIENTELLTSYDVLIYTPAIGSGVSFDVKNHIDKVYGIFTNNKKTGGTQDAMQGMARVRHPKENQWIIALDNSATIYKALSDLKISKEIENLVKSNFRESCFYGKVNTKESESLVKLYSALAHGKIKDKNNFNDAFCAALQREKITVSKLQIDDIQDSASAESAEYEIKEETRQKFIDIKTKSAKIDDDQAATIKARLKFRPDEVTQDERDSLERFRFEAKFNICCDEVEDLDLYIELDDNGAIEKCINREIAQSENAFSQRYVKALVGGLGAGEAFKVDITDKKIAFNLKRKLYKHVLKFSDGREYSHKDLKRSAIAQWIDANRLKLALYEITDIPKNWKEKPALIINRLLENMGYGHDSRKTKKDGYLFRARPDESIDALIEDRMVSGNSWTERTSKLMDLFDSADDGVIAVGLAKVSHVDGLDIDVKSHIENCLMKLPASMHELAIDEYLRLAELPRDENSRLSSLAGANLYLLDLTEKHGLKRVS